MDYKKIQAIIKKANFLGEKNNYDIFEIYEQFKLSYLRINFVPEEYCTLTNSKVLISNQADELTTMIHLAHELGHFLLHHESTRSLQNEHEANLFAFTIIVNFFK